MSERRRMADFLDREVEKPLLEAIYDEYGVATDQLRRQPQILRRITDAFNRIASRDFEPRELLRYMINRRKAGDWIRLGGRARRFPPLYFALPEQQVERLKQIYLSLDLPSDEFLFRPREMARLSDLFFAATGRRVAGATLVGLIVARRKRGEWPTIRTAFGDIGDIVGM